MWRGALVIVATAANGCSGGDGGDDPTGGETCSGYLLQVRDADASSGDALVEAVEASDAAIECVFNVRGVTCRPTAGPCGFDDIATAQEHAAIVDDALGSAAIVEIQDCACRAYHG